MYLGYFFKKLIFYPEINKCFWSFAWIKKVFGNEQIHLIHSFSACFYAFLLFKVLLSFLHFSLFKNSNRRDWDKIAMVLILASTGFVCSLM